MPLTALDMNILKIIALYYVLTREQVQKIGCAGHASGRGTRKRLLRLAQNGLIVKHKMQITLPGMNGAAPAYYPTKKGAETLANFYSDDRFLATNTKHPRADRLAHWIAINETRMVVESSAAATDGIKLLRWITEWETVNKDAAKTNQFCLHTQLTENPPLSCSPDAGFLIERGDKRMVYYLEEDRGTSGIRHIAARKSKGYDQLKKLGLHRKHFPETTFDDFRVLFVTTNDYRAEKAVEEMQSKPGNELWLSMNRQNFTDDNFFVGHLSIDQRGEIGPLIKMGTQVNDASCKCPTKPHSAVPAES